MGVPTCVVPTINLHVLPSFAVIYQRISRGTGEGGGDFRDGLVMQHICGIPFYIHQHLVYQVSGGTECIWKYGPPGGAEDNGPGI